MAAHHISNEDVPDADSRQEAWQELMQAPIDLPPNHSTSFVVIADPAFHRVTDLVAGLDYAFPEAAKIGGFVSSATQTARRALFCWSAGTGQAEDGIVKVYYALYGRKVLIMSSPVHRAASGSIWRFPL